MFTACAGNLGTHNIHGGFFVGRKVVQPMSVAKEMNYKGEKCCPRLKQRTVVTDGFSTKKRNSKGQ